jgi:hypothetical protein
MKAKELVTEFYHSDALRNKETLERFLHEDIEFHWNSSKGFLKMNKKDLIDLACKMERYYTSARVDFSHIIEENNNVSVRYSYFVTPIETPNEETILANFITIWEVKENKLFRGYQISQLS